MFGYTLIKKSELERLEKESMIVHQLVHFSYWFSGWQNVYSLLEKFTKGEVNGATVWEVREEFAKTMGTDRYGSKLDYDKFNSEAKEQIGQAIKPISNNLKKALDEAESFDIEMTQAQFNETYGVAVSQPGIYEIKKELMGGLVIGGFNPFIKTPIPGKQETLMVATYRIKVTE